MTIVARIIGLIVTALLLAPGVLSLPCNDPNAKVQHVCAKMKKVVTNDGGDWIG